ncbi:MAG TPA: hypothetical protein VIV40_03990 [Kofleriaceae bacterium]
MRSFVVLALVVGCADPVVDMQLVLPKTADTFDTTCITAVEVRVTGGNYLQDSKDYRRSCIEISGGASYEAIRDAIRGRFEVAIPESGFSGIEIYGWSGPSACKYDDNPFVSPDLLFFGRGDYVGQDRVDIPVTPNLSCKRSQVNVRMVDMFALVGGATCAVAGTLQAAGVGSGTLVPRLYGKGNRWFGNLSGADAVGNLATFMASTQTGPQTCLAFDGGSEASGSTGCVVGGPSVCAAAGEIEQAAIPYALLEKADNFDASLMTKFPGIVFGSVWSSATPRTTLAGATVSVDANHGKVIYLDPPNASGVLGVRGDQSATGPSGLFVLYSDQLVSVKVSAAGVSRNVTLGAIDESAGGAIIVMGP